MTASDLLHEDDDLAVMKIDASAVQSRIRARWADLPAATLRVAQVVLDDPQAVLDLPIAELAERAGTSAATVTRFARQIGYAGYPALRMSVATDRGRRPEEADLGRAFGPDDPAEDVRGSLLAGCVRTLRETAESVDLDDLQRLAEAIARSRHVDLYGVGSSGLAAEALAARMYRIGVVCNVWSEVHAGLTSAVLQTEDCVAIGYSHTGRTAETIQMLQEAGRHGCLTVAVTNDPDSPLAEGADIVLRTAAYEQFLQPDDLAAYYSQVYVGDLLYVLTAQVDYDRASRNLAASARAVTPHRSGGVAAPLRDHTPRKDPA
ncbi:MurR/RpiR family transcriptional regulator [Amnibacterium endophyticum]|uniref:MurR/RpiR family transcriptional regulator n=1 Tax=Amnibacterium endophyticum TaxID=2109337 RepID=A0ABW4LEY3_9MICO